MITVLSKDDFITSKDFGKERRSLERRRAMRMSGRFELSETYVGRYCSRHVIKVRWSEGLHRLNFRPRHLFGDKAVVYNAQRSCKVTKVMMARKTYLEFLGRLNRTCHHWRST